MSSPAYMAEPWFALLQAACARSGNKATVAATLGVSAPTIYQVLNGSGLYGNGQASTKRLADKVLHQLGSYECPHLSGQNNTVHVITADECRTFAHRNPPIGAPRAMAHWQACRTCEHRDKSAPPVPRPVVPRKGRTEAPAAEEAAPTPAPNPNPSAEEQAS